MMRTDLVVDIPPIPAAPPGAGPLVLTAGPSFRILFNLAGRMPTGRQEHDMRRSIERTFEQRWAERGDMPGDVAWQWKAAADAR